MTEAANDYSTRRYLPGTSIELLADRMAGRQFRSVLFDFDGTLSLIREGWPEVMIPMMVRVLRETSTRETDAELRTVVEDFVMRLNGRQTIYQMIQLADEVKRRGGQPRDPLEYKHQYHELLWQRIENRVIRLRNGSVTPELMTVPGTHALLERCRSLGLRMYLASGTDLKYVRDEADAIDVARFFDPFIYGAIDDYRNYSKQMVIDRILREESIDGAELLGFGDGFVEIEEVKRVGGVAIAVASDEVRREGVNEWKRNRLIQAGADIVIPDYRDGDSLLSYLVA